MVGLPETSLIFGEHSHWSVSAGECIVGIQEETKQQQTPSCPTGYGCFRNQEHINKALRRVQEQLPGWAEHVESGLSRELERESFVPACKLWIGGALVWEIYRS